MKIAIGNDHAGFLLKVKLTAQLTNSGHNVHDLGSHNAESVDYPDYARLVAEEVRGGKADFGIVICGTGNGINIAANKFDGIRSALCWNEEIARLARQHNNANVLALPARFINEEEAERITNAFINEKFEGGRHQKRVEKIGKKMVKWLKD